MNLRKKKEALAKKKPAAGKGKDVKKDAIAEAVKRVAAQKAAKQEAPKNTGNLTPAQQKQVDAADKRRQEAAVSKAEAADKPTAESKPETED